MMCDSKLTKTKYKIKKKLATFKPKVQFYKVQLLMYFHVLDVVILDISRCSYLLSVLCYACLLCFCRESDNDNGK